jgi:hypothetical protein
MNARHAAVLALIGWFTLVGRADAYCIGSDKLMSGYEPQYYFVSHEFARAKYVIEAKVLRERWLREDKEYKHLRPPFQSGASKPEEYDLYSGVFYDVKVLQVFKGKPKPELRLFSENSTGRFWLNVGSEYVLFIFDGTFDPPVGLQLTSDNCGNSADVKDAKTTIRTLQGLSERKP